MHTYVLRFYKLRMIYNTIKNININININDKNYILTHFNISNKIYEILEIKAMKNIDIINILNNIVNSYIKTNVLFIPVKIPVLLIKYVFNIENIKIVNIKIIIQKYEKLIRDSKKLNNKKITFVNNIRKSFFV